MQNKLKREKVETYTCKTFTNNQKVILVIVNQNTCKRKLKIWFYKNPFI